MRILLTTDTIGGVWTFTKELSTGLLRRGHAVALVSLGREPSEEQRRWCAGVAEEFGDDFRYKSSAVPLEWMSTNDAAYADAEPLLLRVAEELGSEVLHANQFCFGRLPVSIPKVVTAHSDVLSWAEACRPDGLEESEWLGQYRSLVQSGLHNADAVVAPTRWMLDVLKRSFAVDCEERVIYNGRGLPLNDGNEERVLQAVCVGRLWDEAKRIALLTAIDSPMPIVLAGESRYEGAAAVLGLGKVSQRGLLSEGELLKLLRGSSVYVAPAIYEPFGLALLEAALCGCALVVNDLPSLREVWGDVAFYFADAEGLVRLLQELMDSPEMLLRGQRLAYDRALEFSADRMTVAYLKLYTELLESGLSARVFAEEFAIHGR